MPPLDAVLAVLALQGGYNTNVVLLGVSLLGAAAGLVGSFAVLRGRALMCDTLGHAALPGIALAFLTAVAIGTSPRSLPVLLAGAALSGLLGVLAVHAITRWTRLPEDAAMAAVLSVSFGLGYVLLSYVQTLGTGAEGGIVHFILGQAAGMAVDEAYALALMALVVLAVTLLLFKELRLVCFDADFFRALGGRPGWVDLVLLGLITVVTVAGLRVVGLVLIIALLVIPAAAARFWTERLEVMVPVAALIGAASGCLGAAASAVFPDLPAGAVIVLVAGAIFAFGLLFAPARGLVAAAVRRASFRLRVARAHLLRALVEHHESTARTVVSSRDLRAARGWSKVTFGLLVRWLVLVGAVARVGDGFRLTARGEAEALRLVRNHRLWEQYLLRTTQAGLGAVDRSADRIEHVLSAGIVRDLEAELDARGRWPSSPHPLAAPAGREGAG